MIMAKHIFGVRGSLRAGVFAYSLGSLLLVGLGLAFTFYSHRGFADASTEPQTNRPSASSFYRLPRFVQPTLSPSGDYLASRVITNNQLGVLITALETDEEPIFLAGGKGWQVNRTLWLSDDKKLVSFSQPSSFRGTPLTVTRTMLVDTKTKKTRTLFKREKGWGFLQIQDAILGGIYGQPDTFLIAGNRGSDATASSVFAVKGARSSLPNRAVQNAQKNILFWQSDRLGSVRVGQGFTGDQKRGVMKFKDSAGHWVDVSSLYDREAEVLALPTQNPNLYYVLMLPRDADGELEKGDYGLRHVYEYDVASGAERLLFAATHSEVSRIQLDPKGEEIVLLQYQDEAAPPQIYSSEIAEIYALLSDKYPDAWIGLPTMADDFSRAVVSVNSPTAPGLLYLYNAEKRNLAMIAKQYPNLDEENLGPVYPLRYAARDGLEIPAYVTLPHGLTPDSAEALPFVVLPHGGPHARDFRRFDWMAQMLANAGYGVLQMNFRGSTGHGVAFEKAGRKEWGQAMVNDVTDGAQWLIAQGLADSRRMCIVGASFGGYVTMLSAVREPSLYQCGVALNGVSDLPALLRRVQRYIGGRYASRHIGRLWKDKERLRRDSPIRHVERVQMPLLLVASEKDRTVDARQSRRMAKALEKSDKQVELLELADGDHYLSRQNNRQIFAEALLEFLHGHLHKADQPKTASTNSAGGFNSPGG